MANLRLFYVFSGEELLPFVWNDTTDVFIFVATECRDPPLEGEQRERGERERERERRREREREGERERERVFFLFKYLNDFDTFLNLQFLIKSYTSIDVFFYLMF